MYPWRIDPRLAPWVLRMVGYIDGGDTSHVRREIPIVGTPLIFVLGAPYQLSERGNPALLTARHRSFHAGIFDVYTLSQPTGPTEAIQVDLTPLGARRLTGIPMHETANGLFPLRDILGPEGPALEERLANTPDWHERLALVERFLLDRIDRRPEIPAEMRWAWRQLLTSRGNAPVTLLTEELQWSRKRLREVFLRELGLAPKIAGRLIRFRHAMDLAAARPQATWAEIALAAGYFDQAHLTRDVRAFAGAPPGAIRNELAGGTFVQDPVDALL